MRGVTARRLWERIAGYAWGSASMALLVVSVASGVVVGLQYDPADPFYSAAALDAVVPFGGFWRSLHFFSSQLFVLFLAGHVAVMAADARRPPAMRSWSLLVASLAVAVLLLFTGYVLRGDVTGEMAGRIAEQILEAVPVAGPVLDGLLFSVSSAGLVKVVGNHFAGLPFVWLLLSWEHVRRYSAQPARHATLLFALLLWAAAVPAPLETAGPAATHVTGPWFFLGIQELLRWTPPFWGGVAYPLLPVLALLLLPARRRPALLLLGGWLLSWAGLSVAGLWWPAGG